MGFWNSGIRSRSRSRSRSPSRHRKSTVRPGEHHEPNRDFYSRPTANRSGSSFIDSIAGWSTGSAPRSHQGSRAPSRGQPGHQDSYSNSRGFFGSSKNNHSYGSSSRARPRSGLVAKVKKWLRDLYYYMKKHPMKVFFLVIMPLITGGALTKLLSKVGIRLPPQLERMMGSNMNRGAGDRYYSRGGARDFDGGTHLPGMGGGVGDSAMGLMKMAKMFM